MARETAHSNEQAIQQARWRHVRPLVSALLLVHLTVVIATPLALVAPQSSLAVRITEWAAPYLQAGNVSHGYAFFAPDPGPSHLLRYEIVLADGRTETGQLPDVNQHWPRLLYHRHFMLSEQLASMAVPAEEPPRPSQTDDARIIEQWKADYVGWMIARARFLDRATSYARHLLKAYDAREVRLHLVRHELLSAADVQRGRKLTEKQLYIDFSREPVVTVKAEEAS
ncbi:MAG: hypothetical protein OES79_01790 [Planctomycetota bacterium]|nr:hypothetical protein [Planctomycetota bacterium]